MFSFFFKYIFRCRWVCHRCHQSIGGVCAWPRQFRHVKAKSFWKQNENNINFFLIASTSVNRRRNLNQNGLHETAGICNELALWARIHSIHENRTRFNFLRLGSHKRRLIRRSWVGFHHHHYAMNKWFIPIYTINTISSSHGRDKCRRWRRAITEQLNNIQTIDSNGNNKRTKKKRKSHTNVECN